MTACEHIEMALSQARKQLAPTVHLEVAIRLAKDGLCCSAAYNLGAWVAAVGYPQSAIDDVGRAVTALELESALPLTVVAEAADGVVYGMR